MNGTGGHWYPRRVAGLAAAADIAVFAAACDGSGGPASPAVASHPAGYQEYGAYSQCLRAHGAPFWPEPSQIPHGVFDSPFAYIITARILAREHGPGWQAALTACRETPLRGLPFTAAQISALRARQQKLARMECGACRAVLTSPRPPAGRRGLDRPRWHSTARVACYHIYQLG